MDALTGKIAVITGASRGIGRQLALALTRHGAKVALLARGSAELDALAAELGTASVAIPCDVADPASVRSAFVRIAEHFEHVDILVNNAALCTPHLVARATDAAILQEINVNLVGPIYCAREAIPLLVRAGGGDIINVSSESVRFPFPHLTIYAATKGGLETFSTGLRDELRSQGTRVTILRAGNIIGTSITRDWPAGELTEIIAATKAGGFAHFTGAGSSPKSVCQAVLSILALPRDVNTDIIELRSM